MTTGEKIAKQRKELNLTQEDLAYKLNVSRQSVSKWESDSAYPETNNIIQLAEIFKVSVDYLLMDKVELTSDNKKEEERSGIFIRLPKNLNYEYKSKRKVLGMPLVHINIGFGRTARGFFSIGLVSKGIFSLGFVSLGVFSFGLLAFGLVSFGVLALGLLGLGAFSFGIIAIGAIAIGLFSLGAISVGLFSVGALASGYYGAIGDVSHGMIAIGETEANGTEFTGKMSEARNNIAMIREVLTSKVPQIFNWFLEWFLAII